MADYYDGLLKLCGFEDEEINAERPRIERAFRKLELGPADMKSAEIWLRKNHEIDLVGVRKILRLWLRELFDLVLVREEGKKKLVYYGFPSVDGPAMAIAAASDDIYCTCPDVVLGHTLGQIFNKLNPILEEGERNGLPPGHGLCSLQQIRVGGMAKGIIPVPDMVLTSSYFCDMGSKTDELLHQRYGHPAVYMDGSMDSRWGDFPDCPPERVDYLGGRLEESFAGVRKYLGVEVTQEARVEGAACARALLGALGELSELMNTADQQPLSIVTVELARRLTSGSAGKRVLTEGPQAIALLNQGVKERIDRGVAVVEKGAPKVMVMLSNHSDPRIMRMIENCGLSVPQSVATGLWAKYKTNVPFISGDKIAKHEMVRGWYHGTYGRIVRAAEIAQEAGMDGIIWNYLYHCRPLSLDSHLFKQYVEKETGIPVLSLEFDLADSRTYSAESLRTRVETFAEMLRARKASLKT